MSDFGDIGYATIGPGTSKKEFISFTSISQASATAKATLGGVTRGLQFTSPYTSSSSLAQTHSGGSKLIISNPPQFYEKFANIDEARTITAVWTFASNTLPRLDGYLAPTMNYHLAPKGYVDSVATSGAAHAGIDTAGLIELATKQEFASGTAVGGSTAQLGPPNSYFAASSSATTTGVVTNTVGKIRQGFLDLTDDFTFTGVMSMGSTTINNIFAVTGTSTFAATTTFGANVTLQSATPTAAYDAATKAYVDETASGIHRIRAVSTTTTSGKGNIDYMSASIGANENWIYEFVLFADINASGNGGWAVSVTAPAGATTTFAVTGAVASSTSANYVSRGRIKTSGEEWTLSCAPCSADVNGLIVLKGSVMAGGTAGTVQLQWGSDANGLSVTLREGSYMIAHEVVKD